MTKHVATYPTDEQLERWKCEAAEMDMSFSEWIQAMVEAGMKKFSPSVERDEDINDLRKQRNNLRKELEARRSRVQELETALYQGEREAIAEYIENNPGAEYGEIIQHMMNSTPERVSRQLDVLDGERVRRDEEMFYPIESEK
ncbi:hypothetical protein KI388_07615 [Halorubrum sp. 2020YC2]|nr:hypothetical protein KI388_07615 [Halorubrum sp. 2020YC2]